MIALSGGLIAAIATGATALFAGIRWMYNKFRTHDVIEVFVHDMATNHLPHIYHALQLLCAKEGIETPDPPAVHFIDFRSYDPKGKK